MTAVQNFLDKLDELQGKGKSTRAVNYEEEDTYRVTLTRGKESTYGLAYRVTEQGDVVVTAILPASIAEDWNLDADLSSTICTGDKILAVNTQTASSPGDMLEEMRKGEIEVLLAKCGPRWHINGITAECMELILSGHDKGLQFELKEPDEEDALEETDGKMTGMQISVLTGLVCLPSFLLIVLCSDMGMGFKFYETFATVDMNTYGNGIIFFASVVAVALYIADWSEWPNKVQQMLSMGFCIYAVYAGAICKSRFYPQAPLVVLLLHIPIFMGFLRATLVKSASRRSFYLHSFYILFIKSGVILAAWLFWMNVGTKGESGWAGTHRWDDVTRELLVKDSDVLAEEFEISMDGLQRRIFQHMDCDLDTRSNYHCTNSHCTSPLIAVDLTPIATAGKGLYCCSVMDGGCNLATSACSDNATAAVTAVYVTTAEGMFCCNTERPISTDEKLERADGCAKWKTLRFLVWVSPLMCAGINFFIALFCCATGVWLNVADSSQLEKVLKQFLLVSVILLTGMWVSISVAGASMRLTGVLLAFCVAGLVCLLIWVWLEIGAKALSVSVRNSRAMKSLFVIATSDWFRAAMIIVFNVLIPCAFAINILNQHVRRLRGATRSDSRYTDGMQKILENLANWNWSSIFIKLNWLIILYWVLSVGVAKLTQVFLSWLTEQLMEVDFIVVMVIFFIIGIIMFLLPPVPGLPVYMCSGIVLAARARDGDGIGFWWGAVIACFLSLVLKLVAVCGQYMIGYFMGKSVKIQQMVGVDRVFIRAVERVLQQRGLPLDKVAVLIGGPDWPTSVLCGILKLNILQCVWGTVPVFFVSSPVVLAGAFMAGNPGSNDSEEDKENSLLETLNPVMLGIAALGQLASGVVALYYIQEVINLHGAELAEPRPEHEPVARLTKAEQDYNMAYNQVLDWRNLSSAHKPVILGSSLLHLLCLFVFLFFDEACFYPFKVDGRISDPFEDDGLNGHALNIIKWPGWIANGVFVFAAALHLSFLQWAKVEAQNCMLTNRRELERLKAEGVLAQEVDKINAKQEDTEPQDPYEAVTQSLDIQRSKLLMGVGSQGLGPSTLSPRLEPPHQPGSASSGVGSAARGGVGPL